MIILFFVSRLCDWEFAFMETIIQFMAVLGLFIWTLIYESSHWKHIYLSAECNMVRNERINALVLCFSRIFSVPDVKSKWSYDLTSGMVSWWHTMLTMSSRGKSEWHLISVKTFLPIVQQARSRTSSMWYRSDELSSILNWPIQ